LEIRFTLSDQPIYVGSSLEQNKGEQVYLYHKDPSGKPGLFLSWRISFQDVKKLQSSADKSEVSDLLKKKFDWFARFENGQVRSNCKLFNSPYLGALPEKESKVIQGMFRSYAKSLTKIREDCLVKLRSLADRSSKTRRVNELLVTIAFVNDSRILYPKDFPAFVELFMKGVTGA
jgi:hypothetical protein